MALNTQRIIKLGILLVFSLIAQSEQQSCPGGEWVEFRGRCFLFKVEQSRDHKTWHNALSACKGYNGGKASLVSIHNAEENTFIRDTAVQRMNGGKMHLWIGMSKKQFGYPYLWEDGSTVDYVNWAEGEPNDLDGSQPCCRMFEFDGSWDDYNCVGEQEWEEYHGYICQAEPGEQEWKEYHGYICQAEPASGGNTGCQSVPEAPYPGCCSTGDVFAIIFGILILAAIVVGVFGYLYLYKWDKKLPWQQSSPGAPTSFDNPQFEKSP